MPVVEKINIAGFKSIGKAEVKLRPVNVLIGANGSGKSNFIGAFDFLRAIRSGQLQDYVARAGGADRILHFGSKVTKQVRLHISFENEVNQYEIILGTTETDQLYPVAEDALFWNKNRYTRPYSQWLDSIGREAGISGFAGERIEAYVRNYLDQSRIYHFHDTGTNSPFKKTGDLNDNRFLRPDGSNLAAFLYFLREKHPIQYDLIRRTIQLAAPFFDDFQLEPLALNPNKIRLEWRHQGSDAYFDVTSFSDGTLRFIALATLFLQPDSLRPSVILLDEPELGMHPYAVTLLESLVGMAADNTQVILATQSPNLLDHFSAEDVLVANLVNGGTEFTQLNAEQLDIWLERYSLGELWEKNEIGGRPAVNYLRRHSNE